MWPADCRPQRLCFWDMASFPVSLGVIPGNTCIYKHNTCLYLIYIQIPSYTYIYIHKRTYWQLVQWSEVEQQYTCRYMLIRAYTCIYLLCTNIFSKYVYLSFIHEYLAYTCKVKNGDFVQVPKKMHVYCMYFNVYERI